MLLTINTRGSICDDRGMSKTIGVGPIKANPGEKARGKIEIVEHADGYLVDYLPLAIINGSKPGVKLWLEAGFHGDEVEGIADAFQLIDDLDPADLSGTVIIEPCVSPLSFLERWRYNPIDLGMMSAVEGNTIPTFSERLKQVREEAQRVLQPGDFYLSLHGPGASWGETYIELEWADNPTSYEKKCLEFAEAIGAPIIGGGPGRKVYDHRHRAFAPRAREDFAESGIVKITLESKAPYKYVMNALKYLRILQGQPTPPEKKRIYCKEGARVMSHHRGLWIPKAKPGDIVEKGQSVAIVRNMIGDILEEVNAPFKGVVIMQRPPSRVDPISIDQNLYYGALVGRIE